MRATTFGTFAAGFAVGMATITVVLWAAGVLRRPAASVLNEPAEARPATTPANASNRPAQAAPGQAANPPAPEDTGMPNLGAAPKQPPIYPAPGELPLPGQAKMPTQGEAERSIPETADQPMVPIAGVNASQIKDTFYDKRDGHQHDALDIMAPRGTPVLAAVEGNVAKLFHSNLGGLTVYQFDDTQSYCYYYAHLDRYAPGLKEGTLLRKGQTLGYVGTTGDAEASAPHLHFAVFRLGPDRAWWKGKAIDPLPLLR